MPAPRETPFPELAARDAALLAWLALEGPTPRVRIAALLWPDNERDAGKRPAATPVPAAPGGGCADDPGQGDAGAADGVSHDLAEATQVLGDAGHELSGEFASGWRASASVARSACTTPGATCARRPRGGDYDGALIHAKELLALEPLSEVRTAG